MQQPGRRIIGEEGGVEERRRLAECYSHGKKDPREYRRHGEPEHEAIDHRRLCAPQRYRSFLDAFGDLPYRDLGCPEDVWEHDNSKYYTRSEGRIPKVQVDD